MGHGETYSLLEGQGAFESEMCCQIQIDNPRNHIADCIGNIYIDKLIEKIVDAIVDACGNQANQDKSDKLPELRGAIQPI